MNSIDIKSFLIGILLTSTVFFATGWQAGTQKVEIVKFPSSFNSSGKVQVEVTKVDGISWPFSSLKVKEQSF
jgi:hypothetical protein